MGAPPVAGRAPTTGTARRLARAGTARRRRPCGRDRGQAPGAPAPHLLRGRGGPALRRGRRQGRCRRDETGLCPRGGGAAGGRVPPCRSVLAPSRTGSVPAARSWRPPPSPSALPWAARSPGRRSGRTRPPSPRACWRNCCRSCATRPRSSWRSESRGAEAVRARVAALAAEAGFPGLAEVRPSATLRLGEVRVAWRDGWGGALLAEVEARAAAALAALTGGGSLKRSRSREQTREQYRSGPAWIARLAGGGRRFGRPALGGAAERRLRRAGPPVGRPGQDQHAGEPAAAARPGCGGRARPQGGRAGQSTSTTASSPAAR